MLEHLNDSPVTAMQIKKWTKKDPILPRVLTFVSQSWPEQTDDEALKPYVRRQNELLLQDGCLLWEN